jgi:CRP/FNR family cyclic AMP-dependent transcriptional regulator
MRHEERLAQVPLLAGLDETARTALAEQLESVSFPAGTTVCRQGEVGDALYLIQEGTVEVVVQDSLGDQSVLEQMGPGQHFGEMALLDEGPRSATVSTVSDVELLRLSRDDFQQLVLQHPSVALLLLRELSRRLRACHRRVVDLALLDAFARIGRFLADHAVREGGEDVLPAQWSVESIAKSLELAPRMAEQVIKELEMEGYVALVGERLVVRKHILRPDELVGMLIW